MGFQITNKQIDIACDWWANSFVDPVHDNGGDPFAGIVAGMLARQSTITDEQVATFKAALASNIVAQNFTNPWHASLSSDYGPDNIVGNAMEVAGINSSRCPWKTRMTFEEDGTVSVSCGYHAPRVNAETGDLISK